MTRQPLVFRQESRDAQTWPMFGWLNVAAAFVEFLDDAVVVDGDHQDRGIVALWDSRKGRLPVL